MIGIRDAQFRQDNVFVELGDVYRRWRGAAFARTIGAQCRAVAVPARENTASLKLSLPKPLKIW